MKVIYLTDGRDWAYFILKGLIEQKNKKWEILKTITTPEILFPKQHIEGLNTKTEIIDPKKIIEVYKKGLLDEADIMLFYDWSWIVPSEIVKNKICICSHPSPLPKYRGGSPIQHQIINGEKESAVSLFKMAEGLDDGPIYKQKSFSLEGHLSDIIKRIGETSLEATIEMLDGLAEGILKPVAQDESKAVVFKRRKKEESELTKDKLANMTCEEMYNFIRALEDPYPNAFIKISDCIILFKKADKFASSKIQESIEPIKLITLTKIQAEEVLKNKTLLKCSDGGLLEIKEAEFIK